MIGKLVSQAIICNISVDWVTNHSCFVCAALFCNSSSNSLAYNFWDFPERSLSLRSNFIFNLKINFGNMLAPSALLTQAPEINFSLSAALSSHIKHE